MSIYNFSTCFPLVFKIQMAVSGSFITMTLFVESAAAYISSYWQSVCRSRLRSMASVRGAIRNLGLISIVTCRAIPRLLIDYIDRTPLFLSINLKD